MSEQHDKTQANDAFFLSLVHCGALIVSKEGRVYNPATERHIGSLVGGKGYWSVSYRNGKRTMKCKIHRLVWMTFNGRIPYKYEINHIDGNKSNNSLSNLECLTSSENMKHAYDNGLLATCVGATGSQNNHSVLTEEIVKEIKRRENEGQTCKFITETMNLKYQTVWNVIKGRSWRHVA